MHRFQKSGNRESGKAETLRSPAREHPRVKQQTESLLQLKTKNSKLKTEFPRSPFPLSRFPAFRFSPPLFLAFSLSRFPLFQNYAPL
jgi:hypothetical protein